MGINAVLFAVIVCKITKKLVKAIPYAAIAELAIRVCVAGAKYAAGQINLD
jgi:hypothetical protein